MSIKEGNLDELLHGIHKRQKYLLARLFVYVLILFFTYFPTINSLGITKVLFINTTLLLVAPLFIEYVWGMDTYNIVTNWNRTIAAVITFLIVFLCITGLMGGISLIPTEDNHISKISIFGLKIGIFHFKVFMCLVIGFTLIDFAFTLSPSEVNIYKIQDKLDKDLRNQMKLAKQTNRKEALVENFKTQMTDLVDQSKGGK